MHVLVEIVVSINMGFWEKIWNATRSTKVCVSVVCPYLKEGLGEWGDLVDQNFHLWHESLCFKCGVECAGSCQLSSKLSICLLYECSVWVISPQFCCMLNYYSLSRWDFSFSVGNCGMKIVIVFWENLHLHASKTQIHCLASLYRINCGIPRTA